METKGGGGGGKGMKRGARTSRLGLTKLIAGHHLVFFGTKCMAGEKGGNQKRGGGDKKLMGTISTRGRGGGNIQPYREKRKLPKEGGLGIPEATGGERK